RAERLTSLGGLAGSAFCAILWRIMPSIRPTAFFTMLLLCALTICGAAQQPPTFKVDASWPLEMPNHWIMGAVTGVFVDARQHVWVTHLPETLTEEELYEQDR